tara:strand:- start:386 stop:559 length:174 start_codon:yes stop_codon:yes gene_type:complete
LLRAYAQRSDSAFHFVAHYSAGREPASGELTGPDVYYGLRVLGAMPVSAVDGMRKNL